MVWNDRWGSHLPGFDGAYIVRLESVGSSGCPATHLFSSPDLSVLRNLDESINDSHKQNVYIQTSLSDKLYGVRQDYDHQSGMKWKESSIPHRSGSAKAYDGGAIDSKKPESAQTLVQMGQADILLDICVIGASGLIIYEKGHEIVIHTKQRSSRNAFTAVAELDIDVFNFYRLLFVLRISIATERNEECHSKLQDVPYTGRMYA